MSRCLPVCLSVCLSVCLQDCIIKQVSYSRTNTPRGSVVSLSRAGAMSPTNSFMCRSVTHVDTVARDSEQERHDGYGDGFGEVSLPTGVLGMTDSRSQRSQDLGGGSRSENARSIAGDDKVANLFGEP